MSFSSSRRLAGITTINIDGVSYDLVSDCVWSPSTIKRETLIGQDRIHGFSAAPIAGYIAATLRDAGGITVADFNAMENVTVQIDQTNGKQVIGTGMWCVEAQEVKTADATFNVRFESDDVVEA